MRNAQEVLAVFTFIFLSMMIQVGTCDLCDSFTDSNCQILDEILQDGVLTHTYPGENANTYELQLQECLLFT
jgi:hypothetical protein